MTEERYTVALLITTCIAPILKVKKAIMCCTSVGHVLGCSQVQGAPCS